MFVRVFPRRPGGSPEVQGLQDLREERRGWPEEERRGWPARLPWAARLPWPARLPRAPKFHEMKDEMKFSRLILAG